MKIRLTKLATFTIVVFVFSGCKTEHKKYDLDQYIRGYYDASLGKNIGKPSGAPAVYVDFSDGLIQAYTANKDNQTIIQAITQKMVNPDIVWKSLANSQISLLDNKSTSLYNKVTDPKAYKDIMAPIESALKEITASSNDALLITDFEEYSAERKEQFENYPKKYFIDWLKKGNSITFFYTDYPETNKKTNTSSAKHLYFTAFTYGKASPTSFVSQIKAALKNRIEVKTFDLTNDPFTLSNDYGGKENTGIANSTFAKWVNYNYNASAEKDLPYEVVGINKPWNDDLEKYMQNLIKKDQGLFLQKLFLNASNPSAYSLNGVKVNVYDASDDFEHYAKCEEAKQHVPVLVADVKKDKVWDEKSKKDPIIAECYETNSTNLKKEWIYATADLASVSRNEIFTNDVEIFKGHLRNSPDKIELRTIVHPNYKLKNLQKRSGALLRIDYVLDDVSFNYACPALKDFEWNSLTVKGSTNKSLQEAIRNTLQDPSVNPKGKVIYTYFIKFANTK